MKFTESGPDIPDELLVARDEGKVLFFCGAGVSLAFAKLSDFLELAGDVIDDLGSLTGSQARRLHDAASTKLPSGARPFVPVDRMFSSLDLEFDPQEVRDSVARALKPKPDASLIAHKALLDLSRGSDGRCRVVTTNFDRLFEACDPGLKSWGPTSLPFPERPADFEGIIHIHGRVDADYAGMSETVVLSSSDFGKAYLSDGWATHYIRRLMSRFKIIFVGYSADDPPVQYLLEALREEQSPVTNIYAFQFGDALHAREQWLQKGVVPFAFGENYGNLWDTLRAWAARAANPDEWYERTIAEAADGPSSASPIFRGRIAHLASTMTGMNKLSAADPPLPSTWLYAFDPKVRYLSPLRISRRDFASEEIDPFEHFGLDRDEPPPPIDPDDHFQNREVPSQAWTAFVPNQSDLGTVTEKDVGSVFGESSASPRIWKLAVLIVRRMAEAPTLWWAAGQRSLHPNLVRQLEHELRYRLRDSDSKTLPYWRHLLAACRRPRDDANDLAFGVRNRAVAGWTPSLVREAVDLFRPQITVERAFGVAPPMSAEVDPAEFMKLDVAYPDPHEEFRFDTANLPLVVSLWRELLREAEQMEKDIGAWISLDTTRPDDGERLRTRGYGLTGPLVKFTHLMETIEVADTEAAAREVRTWDAYGGLIFERLRIWAAGRPGLTSIDQAEAVFAGLDDETFWSYRHERDLLFAIRDRWNAMSEVGKGSIEVRLLTSQIPYLKDHEPREVEEKTAIHRLNAMHWFAEHGVVFGFDEVAEKGRLMAIVPSWREQFAAHTAQPRVGKVISITTDTDPTSILDMPVNALLPIELPDTRYSDHREHDPFAGYSTQRPARAILALHSGMRREVDTIWHYWSTFLRATAKMQTSARLDSVVVRLLGFLPFADISKLWYPLVEWLAERAARFEARGRGEFDIVWDLVIAAAAQHPSGYKQKPGRDWSFESINAVVGRLVEALLAIRLPEGQQAVPATWIARLDRVLALQGDHGRHALYLLAQQVPWLHHHEPAWTEARILGKATSDGPDADAFWSGFARMHRVPAPDLISMLKAPMLARVGQGGTEEHNLIAYLLIGWAGEGTTRVVSDAELRDVLVLGDDDSRRAALRFASDWAAQDQRWRDLIIPFVSTVWPKQRTLRTPQMSAALVEFASAIPGLFAEVIRIIISRMVPLSQESNLHLDCEVADLDANGIEALLMALEKLLPSERANWPYEGKRLIDDIVASGAIKGPRLDELKRRAAEREY